MKRIILAVTLPAAALALAVAAIAVADSTRVHLDERGCADVVAPEPVLMFVLLWGGLAVACASMFCAIVAAAAARSTAARGALLAFAALTLLAVGALTVGAHDGALEQVHNEALGVYKLCRR